jgi:hypothetical protein
MPRATRLPESHGVSAGGTVGKLEPGVSCQYLSGQQVVQFGTFENISFQPPPPYQREAGARYVWRGVVKIPREGLHTFTRPAVEMKLVIGGQVIFPGPGGRSVYVGDWEAESQILQAGYRFLEAEWIVSPDTRYWVTDCPIHVKGPGVEKQRIPSDWLRHEVP